MCDSVILGQGLAAHEADTHHLIALEKHDSPALVAGGEVVPRGIELYGRDDVRWKGIKWGGSMRRKITATRMPYAKEIEDGPSVISSTSPLSPKHCANLQPAELDAS